MKRASSLVAVLLAISISGAARPARADREDEAQQLFESGTEAFQRGEFESAAKRFMRAFKLVPHAHTAFNAAESWDAAGDRPRAAETFALALERGLERKARQRAESRLGDLRAELGRVRVKAPDGAKVLVGDESRTAPTEIYVEPGVHDIIVVLADGSRRVRRVHARAGEVEHVSIDDDATDGGDSGSTVRSVGYGALIAAGALGVTSLALEVRASSLRTEFNHTDHTDKSQRDAVLRAQTWATVGWVATGVVGVTGIALVLGSSSGPSTTVGILPGGVSVSRSF